MVAGQANCPHYSVANDSVFLVQQNYTYAVTVSNDRNGFVDFLSDSRIECYYVEVMLNKTVRFAGRVRGNAIVCDRVDLQGIATMRVFRRRPLYVFQCVVTFAGGTVLRLGRPSDGFFGVYTFAADGRALRPDDGRCAGANRDADCVRCAWDDGEYVDFVARCLATNPCVGSFGVYTRVYAGNHTTAETPGVAAPACPAEFAVLDVRPTRAPWNATDVDVTVTVKNHRIMVTGGNVSVTVAGRECSRPRPAGPDAIRCTVFGGGGGRAAGAGPSGRGGPVRVRYALLRSYVLTSAQRFEWTYPEATAVRADCDPDAAAPVLTIDGTLFRSFGDDVRVTVGADDGPCETVSLADDRVVCRPGRADAAVRGRVTLSFDGGSWTTRVPGGLYDLASGGPTVDRGQLFEGIVSGGTSVLVRGARLACARRPTVHVETAAGARAEADCRVLGDALMVCRAPRTDASGHGGPAAALRLGFRANFAGETLDLSPTPPDSGRYVAYPDPRLAGFETVQGAVVLYGSDLGMGYRADDVRVRFARSDDDACVVTAVTEDRMVCEPTAAGADVSGLRQVVVTVGDTYSVTLRDRRFVDESADGWSDTVVNYVGTLIAVSTVALSLYFAYSCLKKKRAVPHEP